MHLIMVTREGARTRVDAALDEPREHRGEYPLERLRSAKDEAAVG